MLSLLSDSLSLTVHLVRCSLSCSWLVLVWLLGSLEMYPRLARKDWELVHSCPSKPQLTVTRAPWPAVLCTSG